MDAFMMKWHMYANEDNLEGTDRIYNKVCCRFRVWLFNLSGNLRRMSRGGGRLMVINNNLSGLRYIQSIRHNVEYLILFADWVKSLWWYTCISETWDLFILTQSICVNWWYTVWESLHFVVICCTCSEIPLYPTHPSRYCWNLAHVMESEVHCLAVPLSANWRK